MTKKKIVTEDDRIVCTECGKSKKAEYRNYYTHIGFGHAVKGRYPVCRECLRHHFKTLLLRFDGNEEKCIREFCRMMNRVYSPEIVEIARGQIENQGSGELWEIYFHKSNSMSQFKEKTWLDTDFNYAYGDEIRTTNVDIHRKLGHTERRALQREWGEYTDNQLLFLESNLKILVDRIHNIDPSKLIILKDIAYENLAIKEKRDAGKSTKDNIETRKKLMDSASIGGKHEEDILHSDEMLIGMIAKKIEQERPIPVPSPEWEDVDGMRHMINVWFFGHLCKVLGIDNDASKAYEKEVQKYTVDVLGEEDDLDWESSIGDLDDDL